ncbi:sigma-54-dependent Fis family transcriptional regulator [Alteromonadaceae bacterium M269]|nr:sigma-54-dependent Fis family transcriptional regulator [Alteromonadaceae bacterium M269]
MSKVLIIDDNAGIRTALEVLLSVHKIETKAVSSPKEGLALLEQQEFNLVLQDMNFSRNITSGEEGIELFHQIRQLDPDVPIILITAWTHLETAIELVKEGAADYLQKPWDDRKLMVTINNLLKLEQATRQHQQTVLERKAALRQLKRQYNLGDVIFNSEAMIKLVTVATQVAKADVPVLITGPNGSGKEIIAQIIQANSGQAEGPFIKVNAGALPKGLIESELFGAEEGAYTGAHKARIGRFEKADNGTLFLDEIGNLPLEGQIKLLRVLQTSEFERLGSSQTRRVSVRLICATNSDLQQAVIDQTFRQDLLYRINVIELKVPALAERPDDIIPLAQHFLDEGKTLTQEAKKHLLAYDWPGNVRELENCMKRAQLLSTQPTIRADELGLEIRHDDMPPIEDIEEHYESTEEEIRQALSDNKGIIARAARELGLSRQTLYRRIEKFDISN